LLQIATVAIKQAESGSEARQVALSLLAWVILLTDAYPLWRAWQSNRHTSLAHAVAWAAAAWAGWVVALLADAAWPDAGAVTLRYLALCLTGCAGVAVLGARRPGVGAWNFVVLGLLAVLLLPVAEGWGRPRLNWIYLAFLAATLAVGLLNYLPTRLAAAVLTLALGCGGEVWSLAPGAADTGSSSLALGIGRLALALSPWVALVQLRRPRPVRAEFDQLWLAFRDRFGLVWGQRLLEQFNRAAANAGWPVVLRWRGLRLLPGATLPGGHKQTDIVDTLRGLLKRFGPAEEQTGERGASAPRGDAD
jgi:hypothetical protein